jgi:hypothetical protein
VKSEKDKPIFNIGGKKTTGMFSPDESDDEPRAKPRADSKNKRDARERLQKLKQSKKIILSNHSLQHITLKSWTICSQ